MVLLFLVPESPYFLLIKQKRNEAKKVLQLLNGDKDNKDIDEILKDIEKYIQQDILCDNVDAKFEATEKTNKYSVPDCEEGNVLYQHEQNITIINPMKRTDIKRSSLKQEIPFLPKSDECNGRSQHFKAVPIKIILIITGLFLFTRFCGK